MCWQNVSMRKQQQKLLSLLGSALLIIGGVPAYAESGDWFKHGQLEGFVSQTFSHSSDHHFLSESDDDLAVDLWEAGILGNVRVKDDLLFSAQVLGRQVSQDSGNDVRVDYAFFSLPLAQTMDSQLGMRIGRIRSSFGFYNETRDIPHTRTGILMPQSTYYDMTRNSFYSSDGIEFFADKAVGDKRLSFQLFLSRPLADEDEVGEAASLTPSNLQGDRSVLLRASYGSEFEGFRYALTYYKPEYSVDLHARYEVPGALPDIELKEQGANFFSQTVMTSIEYNTLKWALTFEYSRHKFKAHIRNWLSARAELDTLISILPGSGLSAEQQADVANGVTNTQASIDRLTDGINEENYYLQGLYRFNEQWEGYVRYDATRARGLSRTNLYSRWVDMNAGATYQPDEHWLLRAELHYIDGWARLLKRDNEQLGGSSRYWTAAFFQVAYRF